MRDRFLTVAALSSGRIGDQCLPEVPLELRGACSGLQECEHDASHSIFWSVLLRRLVIRLFDKSCSELSEPLIYSAKE